MKSSSRTILSRLALLATIAASPLFTTDAQAFGGKPGGPFSNGTYFPTDGTFSAVLRATDLVGTLQFSTSESSVSSGTAVVYDEGTQYIGNSSGVLNPSSNEITVNFQASLVGQGQQTQTYTEITRDVTPLTDSKRTVSSTYQYFDSSFCTGQATCKTKNDFPNQKFSGTGRTDFKRLVSDGGANSPFVSDTTYKDVTVTGVRLSNGATAFISVDVRPPSVSVTSISTETVNIDNTTP
jgi:hypothetical protein